MHAKFIVTDSHGRLTSYLGSLNYNRNSRWLNDEVLLRTTAPRLAAELLARYAAIEREIDGLAAKPPLG
jgi:phosphatidylserine/phosphatidylglycerophosphate/cardiolipin synthase-like enzyme